MDEGELLLVAYRLAILTFYIGVLVYALPIPLAGLKRWAPILMGDAVLAAGIALLFYTLLDASDMIAAKLGGSWEFFNSWYLDAFTVVTSLKTLIAAIYSIPGPPGVISAVKTMLSPVDKASTAALLSILTIGGIASLVKAYGTLLAALGVALYAVPFRILRGAGAWLLAFTLVFNAGLQVLPVFLVSVAEAPGSPITPPPQLQNGVMYTQFRVVNSLGDPVRGGVLMVYNTTNGDVIAAYPIDEDGYAVSGSGERLVSFPSKTTFAVEYRSSGVAFPLSPSIIDPRDRSVGSITARAGNIIWSPGSLQLVYTTGDLVDISASGSGGSVTLRLDMGEYVEARYPSQCSMDISNGDLRRFTGSTSWRGVSIKWVRLVATSGGDYTITMSASPCSGVLPDITARDYWGGVDSSFVDFNILAAFILYYFTVPIIYIIILFIASTGLARLLGGRERIPIRII